MRYAQEREKTGKTADLNSFLTQKTAPSLRGFLLSAADAIEGGEPGDELLGCAAGAKPAICDWVRLSQGIGKRLLGVEYLVYAGALPRLEELREKKIYFDFETVNQVIRPIDGSLPFMQIVTQCSVLVDEGDGRLGECVNLIADPAAITGDFFRRVVDSLYRPDAHEYSYVVYNQSFEINRLIEMKSILNDEEYAQKIDAIIANVYDLADFFSPNKRLITISQLHSYYSIKYVLALVPEDILRATGTVSYSSLAVKRGDRAQALSALRFLGALSDAEWDEAAADLKRYCENDVRAMVAVERLARSLIAGYAQPELDFSSDDPLLLKGATTALFEPDDDRRRHLVSAFLEHALELDAKDRPKLTAA